MLLSGSPDYSIDRTFTSTFYFPHKSTQTKQITHIYRNITYLAKEYKQMIDSGEVKNQAELVRLKGISRARVTQIMNLFKLNKNTLKAIFQLGDLVPKKLISERKLRNIINNSLK